jgi:PAS domain S-box-containing protein
MRHFLVSVDQAYRQFDEDREMLERSLELSSQELLLANADLRATLQAFPDLLFNVDHDGLISNIKFGSNSNVFRKYYDLLGKRIQDIPSTEVAEKFSEALARVATTREQVRIEYHLEVKADTATSGREQYYEARLLPITEREIAVIIRNITESKLVQMALLEEKERLSVTLKSIVDGVATSDTAGRIVMINKAMEKMSGWSQEEAKNQHCIDIITVVGNTSSAPLRQALELAARQRTIVQLPENLTLIGKTGGKTMVAMSVAPLTDHFDRLTGTILVLRDITEKLTLEQELIRSERLDSLGLLAGGIAHDFNNVLGAILGNISLAKMHLGRDEKSWEILDRAEKASNRAKELTQQLLTFSRGGAPIRETAYLPEILKETVLFMLSGSKVKCEFKIQHNLWLVDIDKGQIGQVINNLAINAVQAMPDSGVLRVSAANSVTDRVEEQGGAVRRFVKIVLSDSGCGIPPENIPHIFEPYYTTKKDGSGLGLATSYSIIKNHGGRIDVNSEIGIGTVFSLFLPVSEAEVVVKTEKKENQLPGYGRILVLDDDEPENRLKRTL